MNSYVPRIVLSPIPLTDCFSRSPYTSGGESKRISLEINEKVKYFFVRCACERVVLVNAVRSCVLVLLIGNLLSESHEMRAPNTRQNADARNAFEINLFLL